MNICHKFNSIHNISYELLILKNNSIFLVYKYDIQIENVIKKYNKYIFIRLTHINQIMK